MKYEYMEGDAVYILWGDEIQQFKYCYEREPNLSWVCESDDTAGEGWVELTKNLFPTPLEAIYNEKRELIEEKERIHQKLSWLDKLARIYVC